MEKINIAIDGPAASGKSTVGKIVAKKLNYIFFDTGIMYRGITYYCNIHNIPATNDAISLKFLTNLKIKIEKKSIAINETIISLKKLHTSDIDETINNYSGLKNIRNFLSTFQSKYIEEKGFVICGRDIGTVVAPNAKLKIYLTADPVIRAKRRFLEEKRINKDVSFNEVKKDIISRDSYDKNRKIGNLKIPKDAIVIDTSNSSLSNIVNQIFNLAMQRI